MSVDLTALSTTTLTAQALSNLILVNPQDDLGILPQLPIGGQAKSFLFDYEGENTVTLEADITDHYAEDNTALQDQIALKPTLITTHGYIGELTDIVPGLLRPLRNIADKLSVLSPFVPVVSQTAKIATNTAAQVYATANLVASAGVAAWDSIAGGGSTQNKQQKAFLMFFGYYKNRQLFTVQTPWAVFKDMAIKTLRAVQDEDTRVVSSFEVTFKQMRFAQTITAFVPVVMQGRAAEQAANTVDHGVSTPIPTVSILTQMSNSGLA